MLFNTYSYVLIFLPASILTAVVARRLWGARVAQACILVLSLFFYGHARPAHLPLLLGSILVNWGIARAMASAPDARRKRILQLGLVLDVLFLSIFKYANLFTRSIPFLAHRGLVLPDLEFPLGISFFTITQIMYLVDCYQGAIQPASLFDYASFVSFFPYIISGPISRAKRIIHQFPHLGGRPSCYSTEASRGLFLFAMGLAKKVLLAGAFATAADYGFAPGAHLSALEAWFFALCYAMQIYFDFSGYSDMAIGSALMLDIQLPPNFDAPYQATSIIEFWQRWHISLTGFITSYIYTPIIRAFRKRTWLVASLATLASMMISGLWHGPNWTFVLWGTIHGLALVVNQTWRTRKLPTPPAPLGWLLTMIVVLVAFVYFRSPSLTAAAHYLPAMLNLRNLGGYANIRVMNGDGLQAVISALCQIAGFAIAFTGKGSEARARDFAPTYGRYAATVALFLASAVFMNSNLATPFVYFAF